MKRLAFPAMFHGTNVCNLSIVLCIPNKHAHILTLIGSIDCRSPFLPYHAPSLYYLIPLFFLSSDLKWPSHTSGVCAANLDRPIEESSHEFLRKLHHICGAAINLAPFTDLDSTVPVQSHFIVLLRRISSVNKKENKTKIFRH